MPEICLFCTEDTQKISGIIFDSLCDTIQCRILFCENC